ncbi:hypothetical protein NST11_01430 [Caldifermentibacillus hisashii]|uniref:hypothetical protein n=1 Tax=Caldifermentibacillus hisashii TaxID=996558 RepID=UPI0031B763C1
MNSVFSILAAIGVVIHFIFKYDDILSKLSKRQKFGVFISYFSTILLAGICIYYGGAFLTEPIQNGFIKFFIRLTIVLVTLWLAVSILNQVLHKITKGIFPKIT